MYQNVEYIAQKVIFFIRIDMFRLFFTVLLKAHNIIINFQEREKKEEKKEDPDAVAKIPNMDHPQILEPVLHNPDEEDKVPRSDDRNIGKMDNHPQESRVWCNVKIIVNNTCKKD